MKSSSGSYSTTGSFIVSSQRYDLYLEIMAHLPYKFFRDDEQVQDDFWKQANTRIEAGDTDAETLAQLYQTKL